MTLLTQPLGAVCDVCGKETGNLPKHRLACSLEHGLPVSPREPTEAEHNAIMRAGSHAVAEGVLEYEQQLHNRVTDLDVAKLLLALDAGSEIRQSNERPDRWFALNGSPLADDTRSRRNLSNVANEALRLGLADTGVVPGPIRMVILTPALVHLRSPRNPQRPACDRVFPDIKRYRLVNLPYLALVDCQACVDSKS